MKAEEIEEYVAQVNAELDKFLDVMEGELGYRPEVNLEAEIKLTFKGDAIAAGINFKVNSTTASTSSRTKPKAIARRVADIVARHVEQRGGIAPLWWRHRCAKASLAGTTDLPETAPSSRPKYDEYGQPVMKSNSYHTWHEWEPYDGAVRVQSDINMALHPAQEKRIRKAIAKAEEAAAEKERAAERKKLIKENEELLRRALESVTIPLSNGEARTAGK